MSESEPTARQHPRSVAIPCQECSIDLAADSPELRLELTCDDEPVVYCEACWEREFGERLTFLTPKLLPLEAVR